MIDPIIDLTPATLAKACKGDVRKLPSFVVHDDEAWPWHAKIRPAKGKLHMRRSTFLRVVAPQVPVKPGLWVRADAQEFFIDLQPHHLQGSGDAAMLPPDVKNHEQARIVAKADSVGRMPDEDGYGTQAMERSKGGAVERGDLEQVARDPEKRGVSSTFLSRGDTERGVAASDND